MTVRYGDFFFFITAVDGQKLNASHILLTHTCLILDDSAVDKSLLANTNRQYKYAHTSAMESSRFLFLFNAISPSLIKTPHFKWS